MVGVPHLEVEARRDLVLRLVPGEHGLLLGDHDLLLGHQVVEGVDEAPVEVALAGDGVVVHIRVLLVFLLALQPALDMIQMFYIPGVYDWRQWCISGLYVTVFTGCLLLYLQAVCYCIYRLYVTVYLHNVCYCAFTGCMLLYLQAVCYRVFT